MLKARLKDFYSDLICRLFHVPAAGWCSWDGGPTARCICLKCGRLYTIGKGIKK